MVQSSCFTGKGKGCLRLMALNLHVSLTRKEKEAAVSCKLYEICFPFLLAIARN